ncbi:MAG: hypothetical protein H7841_16205 [Magnetospirillum sp. WYHS-4]
MQYHQKVATGPKMYIESRSNFVRLNVAQEVMRFAVTQQAEFVDTMTQQAEEARKEAARKAAAGKEAVRQQQKANPSDDPVGQAFGSDESQPQKVAGALGIAIDIQV